MPSLVIQLQELASDENTPVADLLRKAKVVATKLQSPEILGWIEAELNGSFGDDLPDYRRVPSRAVYADPMTGRMEAFITSDAGMNQTFSSPRPLQQRIREIEEHIKTGDETFTIGLPESIYAKLQGWGVTVRPVSQFSRASIVGVVDAVRNRILDWALQLEQKGILGEGMSFTTQEQELAKSVSTIIHIHGGIGNVSGVIGTSHGIGSVGSLQSLSIDIGSARRVADQLREAAEHLSADDRDLASEAADAIDDAASDPGKEQTKLRKALQFAKKLLPKLASWATKAAVDAEIHQLLLPPHV